MPDQPNTTDRAALASARRKLKSARDHGTPDPKYDELTGAMLSRREGRVVLQVLDRANAEWQTIENASEEIKLYGPGHSPRIGELRTVLMSTSEAIVALRFSQDEGAGSMLKYYLRLPEPPE